MVESSDEPSLLDRIRSSVKESDASNSLFPAGHHRPTLSLENNSVCNDADASPGRSAYVNPNASLNFTANVDGSNVPDNTSSTLPPPAPPPPENGHGEASSSIEKKEKPNIIIRFYEACKKVLFSSWMNALLIFVPVGISVQAAGVNKIIVFAMNAIAIIPLAGLLSHATESVAIEMGDTIGALTNITFGNAVELIIFIALTKNEIRIVQASLLGSILANLLLILGMCFLLGGLRFREQIYNSTVTQMSACLLSLSVMSLLLPTAFHASFTNKRTADKAVLQVSRGTSIILLLVYILYLLFQLKSHAYMYQSTPQHVIDEESYPGVLADMLGSSSSSGHSSSSSGSDTDRSSASNTTAKRLKRVFRGRKRRKSSASSKDTPSAPSTLRDPSASTFARTLDTSETLVEEPRREQSSLASPALGAIVSGDEADTDGEHDIHSITPRYTTINFRDFESEKGASESRLPEIRRKKKTKKKNHKTNSFDEKHPTIPEKSTNGPDSRFAAGRPSTSRVGVVPDVQIAHDNSPKRPFNIRGLSVRDVVPAMPAMTQMLSSTVFSNANPTGMPPAAGTGVTPRALHRSSSLPSRLNQVQSARLQAIPATQPQNVVPANSLHSVASKDEADPKKYMSRTAAIILLLVSTGLVAVCAEFLVSSINYLVLHTNVSEAFVGLIILPIVGNAAEHVTAVTVASKNKMDLAIGVAVGSSIQIALFVTPVIVLLGWILAKDMSLYFSLFETISLFVSAFIVNFLVLDGRSNYLEGALLIATYVIIALAAFFYPDSDEESMIGGVDDARRILLKMF